MFLETLLLALAAHFIGDFALQSAWMASEKGKSMEINIYHAIVYTSTFIIFRVGFSPISLLILTISHIFIDPLKARDSKIKYIWQDQLLHIAVIMFALFVTK